MPVHKLSSSDSFVVTDIADAPATGVLRTGKKILQSSAKTLARSLSYTFASFELKRSGASAGLNAVGEAVGPATAALCDELLPAVKAGELHLDPGKGTAPEALAPLRQAINRPPLAGSVDATVAGVVAAAAWCTGGSLDEATVAIEGVGAIPEALEIALVEAGARVVEVPEVADEPWKIWGAEANLILAGSKPGTLTHTGADLIKATAVVPWGPVPFTTKAFAQLRRSGVQMLPDFLSAAGAPLAGYLQGTDQEAASLIEIAAAITDALEASAGDDGVLLGACYRAESFLGSWLDEPLFGRPLAG